MKRPAWRGSEGFTLLETLAALTILGIAAAVLFQLSSANISSLYGSRESLVAALAGTAKMRQILDQPLVEKSWDETMNGGYRAEMTITEVQKDRTENLKIKLMEVCVNLHWREGTKARVLRLVTLRLTDREDDPAKGIKTDEKIFR